MVKQSTKDACKKEDHHFSKKVYQKTKARIICLLSCCYLQIVATKTNQIITCRLVNDRMSYFTLLVIVYCSNAIDEVLKTGLIIIIKISFRIYRVGEMRHA